MKFENGLIVSWSVLSENASLNQVDIFDDHGRPVTSLNALRPMQDAQSVSISDVSARSGRLIAVAAVYASKEGNERVRPAAALLLFDFSGRLLSAFALQPWRQILRLVVDEDSNVWTLTAHADDKDPSTVPLLVEYKTNGVIAKELLARSMFPLHASSTEENAMIGSPSMGYDSGGLWFWLPGSTELVTIQVAGESPAIVKTGLPSVAGGHVVLLNIVRATSGNLLAEVRVDEDDGQYQVRYYNWSLATRAWLQSNPTVCEGDRLIGVGDHEQVYIRHEADRSNICVFAE